MQSSRKPLLARTLKIVLYVQHLTRSSPGDRTAEPEKQTDHLCLCLCVENSLPALPFFPSKFSGFSMSSQLLLSFLSKLYKSSFFPMTGSAHCRMLFFLTRLQEDFYEGSKREKIVVASKVVKSQTLVD